MKMLKPLFLLVFIYSLGVMPISAQEQVSVREDFWVCPVFESGLYGVSNIAIGGGAALGYGDRVVIGLKVVYWNDLTQLSALELNFLVRFYFFNRAAPSGLFVQFSGGPVILARDENKIAIPSDISMISAGLTLGWRFLLGRHFFIEPAVRGGYPYIVGAGLSAGVRF
jgi:hypothetical protein